MSAWIASAAAAGVAAAAVWLLARCHIELDRAGWLARRVLVHQAEVALYLEAHRQMGEVQRLVEDSVDVSTRAVRDAHLGIARIPFGVLGSLDATRTTSRQVQHVHDQVTQGVYGAVAGVNRVLGRWTRSRLHRRDDEDG